MAVIRLFGPGFQNFKYMYAPHIALPSKKKRQKEKLHNSYISRILKNLFPSSNCALFFFFNDINPSFLSPKKKLTKISHVFSSG